MTRETKIGLLVGLAFIIVIGILLSDHLTSTTEPASAPLGMVGPQTRDSLTTLGRPTVPVTIEAPPPVTPRTPVVTVEEMRRPVAPPVGSVVSLTQPGTPANTQAQVATNTLPAGNDPLSQLANQHSGELEIVGGPIGQRPTQTVTPVDNSNTASAATAAFKEYKAQEGDSLSKIASRFMGHGGRANCEAIVRANPSLKDNPNMIVVGKIYLVPTAATMASVPPAPVVPAAPVVAKVTASEPKADAGTVWYTVKENESLWAIASSQLGSGNAWTTIRDMNKDVLKGGEIVRTNMRLRLPVKGIAATASGATNP